MHALSHAADPFGMLIDPAAIQRALEGSQRLECLNRRICRPLDRVMPPKAAEGDRAASDASVEPQSIDDSDD
ncbi:MAG TPA: hypothetical protein VM845_12860 [Burkholderiaceae bacterium]|jgi:hypothetical protein|nr:hypothetical protein [Burkholderiaceae bacterium]